MNITINFTSFEIRGSKKEIENFLDRFVFPIDIEYFDDYVVVKNLYRYQHLPELKQALELRGKQKSIFDIL